MECLIQQDRLGRHHVHQSGAGPPLAPAVTSCSGMAGACMHPAVVLWCVCPGQSCVLEFTRACAQMRLSVADCVCLCVCAAAADNPKFQAVYKSITADGAKLVLLLRLSPLVPFSLLNYGLGGWGGKGKPRVSLVLRCGSHPLCQAQGRCVNL